MIFKSITLENFRPYYGTKKIDFCSGEKNITLLKAENGSGKTTLLEAIRWGLYGGELKLNSGNHKEHGATSFINKKYFSENLNSLVSASVKIELIGNNAENNSEEIYIIKREIIFKNDMFKEIKLSLEKNGKKEETLDLTNQETINNILPKEIDFFIDGEKLQSIAPELASKNKNKDNLLTIQDSIYRVLGIKSLENAIIDLNKLRKNIEEEYLKGEAIEIELKNLYQQEEEKRGDLKKKRDRKKELEAELSAILQEKEIIKEKLEEIPKTIDQEKKYEKELALLEIKIETLESDKKKLEGKYHQYLSVKAVDHLSNKIIQNAYKILSIKNKEKTIPSRYEKEFLQGLLLDKKCICGESLIEGNNSYEVIKKKIKNAEERKENVELLNECEVILSLARNKENDILKNIKKIKMEIFSIEEEIEKNKREVELSKNKITDINFLEQYDKINKSKEDLDLAEKKSLIQIELLSKEIESLNSEYQNVLKTRVAKEKNQKKYSPEIKKRDFCEKILENLKKLKTYKEIQGREELKEKIEEVYSKINKKNYKVELSEKFEYKVYDGNDGKEIGASGGETKNKALSFIGGLIYY
ncbi:MAG: AAA family ATPase, partial [Cetobacterium sp.]